MYGEQTQSSQQLGISPNDLCSLESQARGPSQIFEGFGELDRQLGRAHDLAVDLRQRLEPAMRPKHPEPTPPDRVPEMPPLAPMAANMIDKIASCNRTVEILNDILGRLEI
jgi:hypothetical protein